MQILFISLTNLANNLLNITPFRIVIIVTGWHLFSNFELKRPKKLKWTPNNKKKIENLSSTHKFYFDLCPKRYMCRRDPIIGSMGHGGGGLN